MEWDHQKELVNVILNTNAALMILNKKGVLSEKEFSEAKDDALELFKKEYPQLFYQETIND